MQKTKTKKTIANTFPCAGVKSEDITEALKKLYIHGEEHMHSCRQAIRSYIKQPLVSPNSYSIKPCAKKQYYKMFKICACNSNKTKRAADTFCL